MVKRKLFQELVDHLSQKEISLITGPRQAGKTTLMEVLKAHLDNRGESTLFLNLDIEWDRPHVASQAALVRKIELEMGRKHGPTPILPTSHSKMKKRSFQVFRRRRIQVSGFLNSVI